MTSPGSRPLGPIPEDQVEILALELLERLVEALDEIVKLLRRLETPKPAYQPTLTIEVNPS